LPGQVVGQQRGIGLHPFGHSLITAGLKLDQQVKIAVRRTGNPPNQVTIALSTACTDVTGVDVLERRQWRAMGPWLIDRDAQQLLRQLREGEQLLAAGIAEEGHAGKSTFQRHSRLWRRAKAGTI
jgi:hypothetical protein